ncbi:MAG: 4-hydroxy-tetrahydrodipicolinate reductase [Ginsengibacter sp.]
MLSILIIGYGKMGHAIEIEAVKRGHHVVYKSDRDHPLDLLKLTAQKIDVAIEFTSPQSAVKNILFCLKNQIPVISGTTGWINELPGVIEKCFQLEGTFLYSSNFSIGVNIFFEINKRLAQLMEGHPEYDITIKEIHHSAKKDKPSGTAITLAEEIINNNSQKKIWVNEPATNEEELFIESERTDDVPGTHLISYNSKIDQIELKHTAHSRRGFALGAVLAAEYISGKKGVYTMQDVLQINKSGRK